MKVTDERFFLITQEDLYKIDGLIGSLNLALSEILEQRRVVEREEEQRDAQDEYHEQVTPYLYPERGEVQPVDPRQSAFDF